MLAYRREVVIGGWWKLHGEQLRVVLLLWQVAEGNETVGKVGRIRGKRHNT